MTIIYSPEKIFDLREELEGALVVAAFRAALDFIAGINQPWVYYAGVALGQMAIATGIPGAAATLYAVGDTVDALLFKSPDGSDARIFLNGIAHATIDTYAASAVWEWVNLATLVGAQPNRIDIVNNGPSSNPSASGIAWLAMGPLSIVGQGAYAREVDKVNTLLYRLKDSETDKNEASVPVYLPSGLTLAVVQAFSDFFVPLLDDGTGSQVMEASVTFELTLPGGLKATPDANILNERGGLITFDTTGPRADSFRIPAILPAIMSGDSFSLEDSVIAALITALTTEHSSAGTPVRPVTSQNYQYSAARAGKRSFRK